MTSPSELEIIHAYTRAEAIEDGVLIDASAGELAELTAQLYRVPVAMTAAVHHLINEAVASPRHCNDRKGVWWDILWMSLHGQTGAPDPSTRLFRVMITGTGRRKWHTLKAVCGPDDHGAPCVTFMLPEED